MITNIDTRYFEYDGVVFRAMKVVYDSIAVEVTIGIKDIYVGLLHVNFVTKEVTSKIADDTNARLMTALHNAMLNQVGA